MFFLSVFLVLAMGGLVLLFGLRSRVFWPTLFVLVSQVTISIVIFSNFGLRGDEIIYDFQTKLFAERIKYGIWDPPSLFATGRSSYMYFLSAFHFLSGGSTLVALTASSVLVGLLPGLLARSCRNFNMSQAASLSAWLVGISPALLVWTPGIRRESLVFVLLALLLLSMSRIYRKSWSVGLFLWITAASLLYVTRYQLFFTTAVPALASAFAFALLRTRVRILSTRAILIAVSVLLIAVAVNLAMIKILDGRGDLTLSDQVESLNNPSSSTLVSGVSWTSNVTPLYFAYNFFRSLTGPPLWEWTSAGMLIFGIEGVAYLLAVTLIAVLFVCRQEVRWQILTIIVTLLPLSVINAVYLVVYGLNSRLRAHYVVFLIPLVAYGLVWLYRATRKRRAVSESG